MHSHFPPHCCHPQPLPVTVSGANRARPLAAPVQRQRFCGSCMRRPMFPWRRRARLRRAACPCTRRTLAIPCNLSRSEPRSEARGSPPAASNRCGVAAGAGGAWLQKKRSGRCCRHARGGEEGGGQQTAGPTHPARAKQRAPGGRRGCLRADLSRRGRGQDEIVGVSTGRRAGVALFASPQCNGRAGRLD
ncbi:MAG: hypothetical protein J3K34DRAFT_88099 [Monoraphidium minutum]|nr:MAG: hypothetical protein J3K34DRAFT_88099 [Monoraphidium minutum]